MSPAAAPRADRSFAVALLGDFSGRGSRGEAARDLSGLRPIAIDRDNFDAVLARIAPRLRVTLGDPGVSQEIVVRSLDDFHPDQLLDSVGVLRSLRELRSRLADPSTFRAASTELAADSPPPAPRPGPAPVPRASGGLLDQILSETSPTPTTSPDAPETELQSYLRRIVAPHLRPGPDSRQAERLAQVDAAVGEQMRALLHHPDFQALEAAWRAVFFLVRRLETDSALRIYLLDVTPAELRADLDPARKPGESGLYRVLVRDAAGTVGGTSWSLLVGNYAFGAELADLELLGRVADLARAAGAPWLSAAEPDLVGSSSAAEAGAASVDPAWAEIRRHPSAAYLGLVFPRFLLRLPYGADSDPCDRLDFEEMDAPPRHEDYLWGNPAFAAALLLAQAFLSAGEEMRPGMVQDVEGLPFHLVRSDGEVSAQPCAEILMTERLAQRILDAGIMPLASLRERDAARLVQFRSSALPPAPLAGWWQPAS